MRKAGESDFPDYQELRKKIKENPPSTKDRNIRVAVLTVILLVGGILAMLFLDDLKILLPDRFYLIPLVIVAFVLVWGFFLPDLIAQEIMKVVVEIPDGVRLLSHVVYSYLLAWLLIELMQQIETRESKKILILTIAILVALFLVVIATLIGFKLI